MHLPVPSSVRRIFERGGAGNLKIMKTQKKNSPLRISPFFCPKLREDQRQKIKKMEVAILPLEAK